MHAVDAGEFKADFSRTSYLHRCRRTVLTVHESKLSHELIGGAAAFEAVKAYEDHERKEGKQVNHALGKELLAG